MTVGISRTAFPGFALLGEVTSHRQSDTGEDDVTVAETIGPRIGPKLEFDYGGHVDGR